MGGGTREQCGSNTGSSFWAPLKTFNLTIVPIWLVTRGGGVGGCGPGRRARGGRWGGAPESSVKATRRSLVPPFGLP